MPMRGIVAYYRVSSKEQGAGGLGMEAQRAAIAAYAASQAAPILAHYEEVETARRPHLQNRPALVSAVAHARRSGAVLVIARLDRLARNVYVLSKLMESGVEFVACDQPHANRLTVHILAALAEQESRSTSERIRAAFAARRARGLSFAAPHARISPECQKKGTLAAMTSIMAKSREAYVDLVPLVADLRDDGLCLRQVADKLNALGHRTQRGSPWSRSTLYALMKREGLSTEAPAWWIGGSVRRKGRYATNEAANGRMASRVVARRAMGATLKEIADELNRKGERTVRGRQWTSVRSRTS